MTLDHTRKKRVQHILDAKDVWNKLSQRPIGAHVYEERRRIVIDVYMNDDQSGHVRLVYKSDPVSVARFKYTFAMTSPENGMLN